MYNLEELFAKIDKFKAEAIASSTADGKKGNAKAGLRARQASLGLITDLKAFRKASVAKNV
jgi:hypothetical protein